MSNKNTQKSKAPVKPSVTNENSLADKLIEKEEEMRSRGIVGQKNDILEVNMENTEADKGENLPKKEIFDSFKQQTTTFINEQRRKLRGKVVLALSEVEKILYDIEDFVRNRLTK